jgi:hypothetical protein
MVMNKMVLWFDGVDPTIVLYVDADGPVGYTVKTPEAQPNYTGVSDSTWFDATTQVNTLHDLMRTAVTRRQVSGTRNQMLYYSLSASGDMVSDDVAKIVFGSAAYTGVWNEFDPYRTSITMSSHESNNITFPWLKTEAIINGRTLAIQRTAATDIGPILATRNRTVWYETALYTYTSIPPVSAGGVGAGDDAFLHYRYTYKIPVTSIYARNFVVTPSNDLVATMGTDVICYASGIACASGRMTVELIGFKIREVVYRIYPKDYRNAADNTVSSGFELAIDIKSEKVYSSIGLTKHYLNYLPWLVNNAYEINWEELTPGGTDDWVPLSVMPRISDLSVDLATFQSEVETRLSNIENRLSAVEGQVFQTVADANPDTLNIVGNSLDSMSDIVRKMQKNKIATALMDKMGIAGDVLSIVAVTLDFASAATKIPATSGELINYVQNLAVGIINIMSTTNVIGATDTEVATNTTKKISGVARELDRMRNALQTMTNATLTADPDNQATYRQMYIGIQRKSFMDKGAGPASLLTSEITSRLMQVEALTGTTPMVNYLPTHAAFNIDGVGTSEVYGGAEYDTKWLEEGYDSAKDAVVKEYGEVAAQRLFSQLEKEDMEEVENRYIDGDVPGAERVLDRVLSGMDEGRSALRFGFGELKSRRYNVTGFRFIRSPATSDNKYTWLKTGLTDFSINEILFYMKLFESVPPYELFGNNCQRHTTEARGLFQFKAMPGWMRQLDGASLAVQEYTLLNQKEKDTYEVMKVTSSSRSFMNFVGSVI